MPYHSATLPKESSCPGPASACKAGSGPGLSSSPRQTTTNRRDSRLLSLRRPFPKQKPHEANQSLHGVILLNGSGPSVQTAVYISVHTVARTTVCTAVCTTEHTVVQTITSQELHSHAASHQT